MCVIVFSESVALVMSHHLLTSPSRSGRGITSASLSSSLNEKDEPSHVSRTTLGGVVSVCLCVCMCVSVCVYVSTCPPGS